MGHFLATATYRTALANLLAKRVILAICRHDFIVATGGLYGRLMFSSGRFTVGIMMKEWNSLPLSVFPDKYKDCLYRLQWIGRYWISEILIFILIFNQILEQVKHGSVYVIKRMNCFENVFFLIFAITKGLTSLALRHTALIETTNRISSVEFLFHLGTKWGLHDDQLEDGSQPTLKLEVSLDTSASKTKGSSSLNRTHTTCLNLSSNKKKILCLHNNYILRVFINSPISICT